MKSRLEMGLALNRVAMLVDEKFKVIEDTLKEIEEGLNELYDEVEKNKSTYNCTCWYCGGKLVWGSDFNYADIHGEGEGICSSFTCTNCGADVLYSLKSDEVSDE